MSAFFIATVAIKDGAKFADYASKFRATAAAHGGMPLLRGKVGKALAGPASHDLAAIAAFPDMAALEAWHASDAYQAIIPLRNQAADMTIIAYEEVG
ncbi:MAG: DUF1330 domain-containing protein [Roseitalea sp.]|nr:DUF1330 domain-containing protein [Roseitalea sp.]MBO6720800.1 DUF1330 domain-containing protein [Roseitalea sp.]MBO6743947.1 DUF1330 domain-containing protein [Roseitalea sp.]